MRGKYKLIWCISLLSISLASLIIAVNNILGKILCLEVTLVLVLIEIIALLFFVYSTFMMRKNKR